MSSAAQIAIEAVEQQADPRAPQRVRHQPRRRTLTIEHVEKIAAHMIRVTLTGDLEGFVSLGFDDHVKLFFPDGTVDGAGNPNMLSRDFTPRRHDPAANIMEIDFAIHDAGPATRWATNAKPGERLTLGGPRGSFVSPLAFDWHLLAGDETALPAIGRRLAELPPGTRAVVVAEIDGPADEIAFETQAKVTVSWAHRNGTLPDQCDALAKKLAMTEFPIGDYYAWVACESVQAKAIRRQLIADRGANPGWMRAAGYWRRGAAAVHDVIED
ncbi:MAG: siderophore-interacting protein [Xanthobacteraceae bacterium]